MKITISPNPRRLWRAAFTMIELLVVVMLIAVLATLVLTLTGRMKSKAKQVAAIHVIKQVATANLGYAQENHGDLNIVLPAGDSRSQAPVVANSFWGRLQPYLYSDIVATNDNELLTEIRLRLVGLFGSKDIDNMTGTFQQGAPIHKDASTLPVPFGFNNALYTSNQPVKSSSFRDMSRVIYFTYGSEFITQSDGNQYTPLPANGARTSNIDWFDDKNAAFIFLDGHMELLSAPVSPQRFTGQ